MGPPGFSLLLLSDHIVDFVSTNRSPTYSSFPQVPRPWKAARRCSSCLYPNDHDANFCQACGTSTGPPVAPVPQPGLDMSAINSRFVAFKSSSSSKPYQKQKSSLEQQLSGFLASLSPPKSMSSASAEDIVKFLISKDKAGRTLVHAKTCDRKVCKCPRHLAAGSVDSLIGKLRAIYNKLGRFGHVNPVSHSLIKEYLKFTREEQPGLAVTSRQSLFSLRNLNHSSVTLRRK